MNAVVEAAGSPPVLIQHHPSAWRSVRVLARTEVVRLARHPAMLAGAAIGAPILATGPFDPRPPEPIIDHLGWGLLMMAWPAVIAMALLTSRAGRDGTEELFGSTPMSRIRRTCAFLLVAAFPSALALIGLVTVGVTAEVLGVTRDRLFSGPVADASMLVGLQMMAMIFLAGVFAVALATWLPHWVAAVVAFLSILQGAESRYHPGPLDTTVPLEVLGWHLLYALGMTIALASVAMARHRRDGVTLAVGIAGVAAAALGGILQ